MSVDIETYAEYKGTKQSEEYIISHTLDDKGRDYFKKNKKKGCYYPVLDSQAFCIGAVHQEGGKTVFFASPNKLWDYIKKQIENNAMNGKRTWIYAHNLSYDWNGFARDKYFEEDIEKICDYPFLVTYFCNGSKGKSNYGWFVDTMGFFPRPLAEVGEMVGMKKMEMPKEIKSPNELKPYLGRDVELTIKAMTMLKDEISELGFKPRKFLTAGQLAITTFMTYIRKNEEYWKMMSKGEVYKGEKLEKCRPAYRGARVQAFKKGGFNKVTQIDINSLYPHIMATMEFPDLKEEIYIEEPLKDLEIEDIIKDEFIGCAECIVEAPNIKLGYLPVRFNKTIYFPTNRELTGTWTILELREALKLGYKIKEMNWAVLYPKLDDNLFKNYVGKMYELKSRSEGTKKLAIKLLMNNLYGKFGQFRMNKEFKLIERHELTKYESQGWFKSATYGAKYIIAKYKDAYNPPYTNLMIALMITAGARDRLYKELSKIPYDDLIYCDTDCIIFKGNHKKKFKISEKLGDWKVEHSNKKCFIAGEKRYYIGEKIKISGVPKKLMDKKMIEKDEPIRILRAITISEAIKSPDLMKDIGGFREVMINPTSKIKGDEILPEKIDERRGWVAIIE